MIGKAIDAKSEALELRELSSEDLDVVSGGWFCSFVVGVSVSGLGSGGTTGENDPGQMFQQTLQQLCN